MKRKSFLFLLLTAALCISVFGHDLFLKLDNYFVKTNDKISIKVINGSFRESEGALDLSKARDITIISPSGAVSHPKESDYSYDDNTSYLNLQPQEEGTYIAGLSTLSYDIKLTGKKFNEYLREDGIPDILAEREKLKILDKPASERYSKHVKIIFQVGERKTDSYKKIINYSVEIIPQDNPYNLKPGDTFKFLCLKDGKALANQLVMSGRESGGKIIESAGVRTDAKGIGKIKIDGSGKWYVKFIQMSPVKIKGIDYESKWTTLSFEVR